MTPETPKGPASSKEQGLFHALKREADETILPQGICGINLCFIV